MTPATSVPTRSQVSRVSIDENSLPKQVLENGQRTYRSITVDGEEIEFSGGFTELHTESYKGILKGNGFGLIDAKSSIEIVHDIRNTALVNSGEKHLFLRG